MVTPYNSYALHMLVKILSNLDRDPDSPTYGSFDRNYWQYKIRDFSSAILQQSSLSLAIAYSTRFKGNIYFQNALIKKYAIAGIMYWAKIQQTDGSFEEYWPNERSIPATAFSLYAICEACDIIDFQDEKAYEAMRKAVLFLEKNTEKGALNQEMAAVAGIRYAGRILNDDKIKSIAERKFDALFAKQNDEGWYSEYNGVDIGYLTVTLDFLIRYYELSQNKNALQSAKRIVYFVKYFIHPDGSLGGEYCTRNTEYFLPYGFEFMKTYEPVNNRMIEKLMSNINRDSHLNSCIDERYVLHYVSTSFLKAISIYQEPNVRPELPYEKNFEKHFDNAMIYIKSTPKYYFICSLMKSGVFKVMDKNTFDMHTDVCYRLYHKGKIYTSEWPQKNRCSVNKGKITVSSLFMKKGFFVQTPLKQTILKLIAFVLGRWLVHILKKIMIYGKDSNLKDMHLEREIKFTNSTIRISDTISAGSRKAMVSRVAGLSMRHTASSRFFQVNSLGNKITPEHYDITREKKLEFQLSF